ncbi:hypothetical protein ACKWTF_014258 [Chironomus riparius]
MMKYFFIFSVLIYSLNAQIPLRDGKCPDISRCLSKFKIPLSYQSIQGYHYLYASVPFFFQSNSKCSYIQFTGATDNVIDFETFAIDKITNQEIVYDGSLHASPNGDVQANFTSMNLPLNFQVIALTAEYAITYSCNTCGFYSSKGAGIYVQVLTRLHQPKCEIINDIEHKLEVCGIPTRSLVYIENKECDTCRHFEKKKK